MKLVVNGGPVDKPVSDKLIEESIYSLAGEGDSFIILSKDEMTYMQTSGDVKNGFILEYQNGSLEQHFSCINPELTTKQVIKAFQSYHAQDGKWKTELSWGKEELESASSGGTIYIVLILILVVTGFIIWKAL